MSAELAEAPGQRTNAYVPQNDDTRERIARLAAPDFAESPRHEHSMP